MSNHIPWKHPCTAHRTNGQPCKRWANRGTHLCRSHGGANPHVLAKGKLNLIALVLADEAAKGRAGRKPPGPRGAWLRNPS